MLVTMIAAVGATSASASIRYAVPTGGAATGDCPEANPCVITRAFSSAVAGDEVRIAPGDYTITNEIANFANDLTVQGTPGAAPPQLKYTGPSIGSHALWLEGSNVVLRNVHIAGETDGSWYLVRMGGAGGLVDRVRIENVGTAAAYVGGTDLIRVRNSVIRAATPTGAAMTLGRGEITGSTIIADGGPMARALDFQESFFGAGSLQVTVRNAILLGGANDVLASASAPSAYLLDIDYSAVDAVGVSGDGLTYVAGTHNVAAPPQLVNVAAAADVHQLPTSPTLNAGTAAAVVAGDADLDGQPRLLGAAPDIGADEIDDAPAVTTTAATDVTMTGATVNGSVNAGGLTTTYHFVYGPSTAYGSRTPDTALPAGGAFAASARISNLTPGTTIHAKLIATNAKGTREGADVTFITLAAPVDPTPQLGALTLLRPTVRTGTASAVRFSLSERAAVTMAVDRLVPGRRQGARCRTILRTGVRCTKIVRRGVVRVTRDAGGAVRVGVPARLGGRALAPGRYRLTLTVTDLVTGTVSPARRVILTVTR
jgi:hypothetical protein